MILQDCSTFDCMFPSNSHAYLKTTTMLIILVHLYAFLMDKEISLIIKQPRQQGTQASTGYVFYLFRSCGSHQAEAVLALIYFSFALISLKNASYSLMA